MTDTPAVFPALLAVQGELDAIAKARRVTEGPARFAFRGVDDIMNALHPALVRHGLLVLPQVQERIPEARTTSKGGTMNVVHLRVRFTFTAADGSTTRAEAWGEGQDSGDKATGKAHSMAYKSAMLQVFSIPTEPGEVDDADHDTTPAAPRAREAAPAPQERPSAPPQRPAHLGTFYEALSAYSVPQAQWIKAHWPLDVPPDRMTVAQAAQAVEWMAANVPPA